MPKIRIMRSGIRATAKPLLAGKAQAMTTLGRKTLIGLTGLCLGFLSGCQTWVPEAGITLPSPHYLRHPPQYFPPSPPYPLPRELSSLEEAAKKQADNPQ
jgi:hypothetical protein